MRSPNLGSSKRPPLLAAEASSTPRAGVADLGSVSWSPCGCCDTEPSRRCPWRSSTTLTKTSRRPFQRSSSRSKPRRGPSKQKSPRMRPTTSTLPWVLRADHAPLRSSSDCPLRSKRPPSSSRRSSRCFRSTLTICSAGPLPISTTSSPRPPTEPWGPCSGRTFGRLLR